MTVVSAMNSLKANLNVDVTLDSSVAYAITRYLDNIYPNHHIYNKCCHNITGKIEGVVNTQIIGGKTICECSLCGTTFEGRAIRPFDLNIAMHKINAFNPILWDIYSKFYFIRKEQKNNG